MKATVNRQSWKWQDQHGFSQAIEVSGARRLLLSAGRIALGAEGKVMCVGDMRGQIEAAMNTLETVLGAAALLNISQSKGATSR